MEAERRTDRQPEKLWDEIGNYYGQTKVLRWGIACLIFLFYGTRLFHSNIFVDSDILMTDPEDMLRSWYGYGRFGLVFLKRFFSMVRLVPAFAGSLLAVELWVLTFFLCFVLDDWSGKRKPDTGRNLIFSIFYLSSPIFAEQFNFLLQAPEIACAMILCVAAAFGTGRTIYQKKSVWWAAVGIVLMGFSFGCYQAFPAFYIALVVISFLCVWMFGEERCGIREAFSHIVCFCAGFGLYEAVASLVRGMTGTSSEYTDGMIRWFQDGAASCIASLRLEIQWIYRGMWDVFYSRWTLPVLLAALLVMFGYGIRLPQKNKMPRNRFYFVIAMIFLPILPLATALMTGMNQPVRSQLTYPFLYAFEVAFLYEAARKHFKKEVCMVLLLLGMFGGWSQGMKLCQLWETSKEGYEQDIMVSRQIYEDIRRMDGAGQKVAFIGTRGLLLAGDALPGDVIGHSVFEWDADSFVGVSGRAYSWFQSQGMEVEKITQAEYQEALIASGERPVWPASGSVFWVRDGLLAVKLSEP